MVNYGYDSYLGIKKETTWGVYEGVYGANVEFIPLNKDNIKSDIAWVERKSELRQSRFPATPVPGRKGLTGGFTVNGYPNSMGLLWSTLLGDAQTVTNPVAGVYQHTWIASTVVNRQLSMQIRKGLANPWDCSGFVIGAINLKQDNEKLLEVEITGAGKEGNEGISTTAVYVETMPFIFYHATVTMGTVGGVTKYCDNAEFSFNQTRKLENWKISGGQTIMNPPFSDRPNFTGSLTIDFESWAEYHNYENFEDLILQVVWVSNEEVVPASGHFYTMTLKCPKIRLKNPAPQNDKPGIITIKVDFECDFADTVDGYNTPLEVILKDGTATH